MQYRHRCLLCFLASFFMAARLSLAGPIHDAAVAGDLGQVRALLAEDRNRVGERDNDGHTALHHAAWNGRLEVAQFLLDQGAAIDARNKDGWTPLFDAASTGQIEIAKLLLARGADIAALDTEQGTALHRAAWNGQTAMAELLIGAGAAVDARRFNATTPLEMCAFFGHVDTARVLLNHGANVNVRVYDGYTPLHQAARTGRYEMCELLLQHGADINSRRDGGLTPLHDAAANGQATTTNFLLGAGADPTARAKDGVAPIGLAANDDVRGRINAVLVARADTEAKRAARQVSAIPEGRAIGGQSVVYKADFAGEELEPGAEWSTTGLGATWSDLKIATTPASGGNRRFLGPFGSQEVRLALGKLPPHNVLTVSFDLYVIGTWDGTGAMGPGPDVFDLSVLGGPMLLHTTFFNNVSPADPNKPRYQSFPGEFPLVTNPGRLGAAENDVLHLYDAPSHPNGCVDAVYRLTFTFSHLSGNVVLRFTGSGLQTLDDESWGLANVVVRAGTLKSGTPGTSGSPNKARSAPKRTR